MSGEIDAVGTLADVEEEAFHIGVECQGESAIRSTATYLGLHHNPRPRREKDEWLASYAFLPVQSCPASCLSYPRSNATSSSASIPQRLSSPLPTLRALQRMVDLRHAISHLKPEYISNSTDVHGHDQAASDTDQPGAGPSDAWKSGLPAIIVGAGEYIVLLSSIHASDTFFSFARIPPHTYNTSWNLDPGTPCFTPFFLFAVHSYWENWPLSSIHRYYGKALRFL